MIGVSVGVGGTGVAVGVRVGVTVLVATVAVGGGSVGVRVGFGTVNGDRRPIEPIQTTVTNPSKPTTLINGGFPLVGCGTEVRILCLDGWDLVMPQKADNKLHNLLVF